MPTETVSGSILQRIPRETVSGSILHRMPASWVSVWLYFAQDPNLFGFPFHSCCHCRDSCWTWRRSWRNWRLCFAGGALAGVWRACCVQAPLAAHSIPLEGRLGNQGLQGRSCHYQGFKTQKSNLQRSLSLPFQLTPWPVPCLLTAPRRDQLCWGISRQTAHKQPERHGFSTRELGDLKKESLFVDPPCGAYMIMPVRKQALHKHLPHVWVELHKICWTKFHVNEFSWLKQCSNSFKGFPLWTQTAKPWSQSVGAEPLKPTQPQAKRNVT